MWWGLLALSSLCCFSSVKHPLNEEAKSNSCLLGHQEVRTLECPPVVTPRFVTANTSGRVESVWKLLEFAGSQMS